MHTLTYLIPTIPGSFELVVLCTPSRAAAYLTLFALRASPSVRSVRMWRDGAMV